MAMHSSQDYGKRLIPQILDDLASTEPEQTVISVATFTDTSHDFRPISALELAKAVDKTAWWLHSVIGRSKSIETAGYIGPRKLGLIVRRFFAAR